MTEEYDLLPKNTWITRREFEHCDAMDLLKAAVVTARTGSDEGIKQVEKVMETILLSKCWWGGRPLQYLRPPFFKSAAVVYLVANLELNLSEKKYFLVLRNTAVCR